MRQAANIGFVCAVALLLLATDCGSWLRAASGPETDSNQVLALDGTNSYVELPPHIFDGLTEATVEARVKWERLGGAGWNRVFNYGLAGHDLSIATKGNDSLWFIIVDAAVGFREITTPGVLKTGEWVHLAAVSGPGGMRLFVNGALVGSQSYAGSFAALRNGDLNRLGKTVTPNDADPPFQGQIDEVRVWKIARTEADIRADMLKRLRGNEPGLAGYWNFKDGTANDLSPGRHHGKLMGNAKVVAAQLPVSPAAAQTTSALELDGNGSYIELPAELMRNLKEATVEGWVSWSSFRLGSRFFDFGSGSFQINVQNRGNTNTLWFESPEGRVYRAVTLPDLLSTNLWLHIAAVRSTNGLQLIVNGTLMPTVAQSQPVDSLQGKQNFLGRSNFRAEFGDEDFAGRMAEVRVWDHARTEAQVRANLSARLGGKERGLAPVYELFQACFGSRW